MTLDDLRVFVAVCRAGSLSAVARELDCTQSAVSQRVKRLEREAGMSLLERQPRGVVPTHAGHVLLDAASNSIDGLDQAMHRLVDLANGDCGSVRVTTGGTTVRHFMSDAIVTFRRRYPKVSLEFRTETSSRNCFDALTSGNLDLAWVTIRGGAPPRTSAGGTPSIEQRPVVDLPWVLAIRADDPLAARARIGTADLSGISLIRLPRNSTSGAHLDTALAELGVRSSSDTSVADWDTALLLAELGLGHAVVPVMPGWRVPGQGTGRAPGDGALRLVPIPDLPPLSVGWAVRRWDALSPLARAFADIVARSCGGEAWATP
ncbi:LysR family transcriptional regulator [Streptomyces sp. SCSIO 30461]|uniref:LysR family transcriptional regulator n=1 Tax=Streptomyces sp. SCSIO 30461 TaxID=3118085 RepID=UPI0030D55B0F